MRLLIIAIGFFLLGGINSGFAQLCTGQLGDPIVKLDFGVGSPLYGPPVSVENTGYSYIQNDNVPEGSYTIVRTTPVMGTLWWVTRDHTDNGGGYMMVVNSAITPSPFFYQQKISGLCANTKYELAAWVMNLLVATDNSPPSFSIIVETTNGTQTYDSGLIGKEDKAVWKQLGFVFTTPLNGGDVTIKIRNNSPGAPNGNDFALDDITLRPCGPVVQAGIGDARKFARAICTDANETLNLTSTAPIGYNSPRFQWQVSTGNGWQDIAGSNTPVTDVVFNNKVTGTYVYRLKVWENGSSPFCGIVSNDINIQVVDKPNPTISSNSPVCPGNTIQLKCQGAAGNTYLWSGPGGFTSTEQNPVIANMNPTKAGKYSVMVTTGGDCSALVEMIVEMKNVPLIYAGADRQICEGETITLHATGGSDYQWTDDKGKADVKTADPTFTPKETTLYIVSGNNGVCTVNDSVLITVIKKSLANAGADKRVFNGEAVELDGSLTLPGASYFWTPATYLDDATKLHPISTPAENTVYTLHVTTPGGCSISSDEVNVRVLERLVFRNVFTPNGDGVNDLWNIGGLITYPGNLVQIFNRYGAKVFESRGYGTAWNGMLNGKELPGGTYYYVINLPSENIVEKGSVTLIR